MTFGIVGSREFTDYKKLERCLQPYRKLITKIVSGGAKGADALAKQYAEYFQTPYVEFEADWDNDGKSAGFIRNTLIVKASDVIIAFWNLESNGSRHTIHTAKASDVPCIIFVV
jgi:hypothetical protein